MGIGPVIFGTATGVTPKPTLSERITTVASNLASTSLRFRESKDEPVQLSQTTKPGSIPFLDLTARTATT